MDPTAIKEGQKHIWTIGDFPDLATLIQPASDAIIDALGIEAGDRVLDVACGTGNLAIPAAKLGADVVGLDLTPRLLEVARERAVAEGVTVEWIEGDAEDLPFDDDSFDHVVSCFGMIFAPQYSRAAAEMRRVCRPGGGIAITAWTKTGLNGTLFTVLGKHLPAPPEPMPSPVDWGEETYLRSCFGDLGPDMAIATEHIDFRAPSVTEWVAYNEDKLGPVVMAKSVLEPLGKFDALRDDMISHYEQADIGSDGEWSAEADYFLATGEEPTGPAPA